MIMNSREHRSITESFYTKINKLSLIQEKDRTRLSSGDEDNKKSYFARWRKSASTLSKIASPC